eukprot:GEMP01018144.1.p1 GENE.GEMP01018144.1~~GEMP01018144.1.p1  ORF type:complete len:712 (+),score=134.75 GEMP01018144.1:72-2207(+)
MAVLLPWFALAVYAQRPCLPDVPISVEVGGNLRSIVLTERLLHSQIEKRSCENVNKKYAEFIVLTCSDGNVLADISKCYPKSCFTIAEGGTSVSAKIGRVTRSLGPLTTILSGETDSYPCVKVNPWYTHKITFICEYGELTADVSACVSVWREQQSSWMGRSYAAVAVQNTHLFFVGGVTDYGRSSEVWEWALVDDVVQWTQHPDADWSRRYATHVVSIKNANQEDELLVFGGNDGLDLNDMWRYSRRPHFETITQDTITVEVSDGFPATVEVAQECTIDVNGEVLVFNGTTLEIGSLNGYTIDGADGGILRVEMNTEFSVFLDDVRIQWNDTSNPANGVPLSLPVSVVFRGSGLSLNLTSIPKVPRWARVQQTVAPRSRSFGQMITLDHNVVVLLGGLSTGEVLSDTWVYVPEDTTTHTHCIGWREMANKPWTARLGHTVVKMGENEIYMFGGSRADGFLSEVWKFRLDDPCNDGVWAQLHDAPFAPRYGAMVTALSNGCAVVLGGFGSERIPTDLEVARMKTIGQNDLTNSYSDVWAFRKEANGEWIRLTHSAPWNGGRSFGAASSVPEDRWLNDVLKPRTALSLCLEASWAVGSDCTHSWTLDALVQASGSMYGKDGMWCTVPNADDSQYFQLQLGHECLHYVASTNSAEFRACQRGETTQEWTLYSGGAARRSCPSAWIFGGYDVSARHRADVWVLDNPCSLEDSEN